MGNFSKTRATYEGHSTVNSIYGHRPVTKKVTSEDTYKELNRLQNAYYDEEENKVRLIKVTFNPNTQEYVGVRRTDKKALLTLHRLHSIPALRIGQYIRVASIQGVKLIIS